MATTSTSRKSQDGRIAGKLRIDLGPRGAIKGITATLTGYLFREGGAWVAYCRELDLSSMGKDQAEALRNVHEAITLFFESCLARGTLLDALRELGWIFEGTNHTLFDERTRPLAKRLPPAFMLDKLRKTGTDWSTQVSSGR
jgi:predicted RNase H-like HicB family nuclease